MKYVFDIETDGLLHEMTVCHCLVLQNVDTGKIYKYSDSTDKHPQVSDGLAVMSNAVALIGHNIIGFDMAALKKLFNWSPNPTTRLFDTWVMSQTLSYQRPHKQGLAGWGERLGKAKLDNTDFNADGWKTYSERMMTYCIGDVELNTQVYKILLGELSESMKQNPMIAHGLRVEHDVAQFNAEVRDEGWLFDKVQAEYNLKIMNKHMSKIESIVEPQLGDHKVYQDKEPKFAKYSKKGLYNAVTARMLTEFFGRPILPEDALSDNPPIEPDAPFQRYTVEPITLSNMEQLKDWLYTQGWKPDDWNVKKIGYEWVRQSPKLTTLSLAKLGRIGKLIDRYYTIKNRRAVIEGYMRAIENNGHNRIHGNMWTIGTPSFRCRHEGIVNLPAVTASYGKMIRKLFIAKEGYKIVGADSAGNQLRGLCHYVNDTSYTEVVVNGDQHGRNATILGCDRPTAKSFLYAILFGAGDAKLAQTLTGIQSTKVGKEARRKFMASLPGFGKLVERLKEVFNTHGAIPGLDGRKVFVRADYQCLNYLLQSAEGITCKAAVSYAWKKIREEGLDARPRIFYHDEIAYEASEKDAARVGEILQESFKEAPKAFGVQCMDGGNYVIGSSYADVH